jgi:hypothetical protein
LPVDLIILHSQVAWSVECKPVSDGVTASSEAEAAELVRHAARYGTVADLTPLPTSKQTIAAGLLVELLLTDEKVDGRPLVHPRGVRIKGAWIVDQLNLEHCECRVGLTLTDCVLEERPLLNWATLPTLTREGCELPGLSATQARIGYDLSMDRSQLEGEVNLRGARIEGRLSCEGVYINCDKECALLAQSGVVADGVFF